MIHKRFYFYNGLLIFSSLVFIIICLVLIFKVTEDFPRSMGVNNFIRDSLRSTSIEDIVLTRDGDCPSSYEIELLATWPGTEGGCIDDDTNEVTPKCDTIEIEEFEPKLITHWNGYQFCVKRNKEYILGYQINCPTGFRHCSDNLCVNEDERCPITSISLVLAQDSDPDATFLVYDFNKYFKMVRRYTGQPINFIVTAFFGMPCYADSWIPSDAMVYPLVNMKLGCGEYGEDNTVDVIETLREDVLYNFNGFDEIFATLPGYKDFIRVNNASLIARKRLALKDDSKCYEGIGRLDFGQSLDQIKSVRTRLIYILILEAIAILTLGTVVYRSKKTTSQNTLLSDWKLLLIVDYVGLFGIDFAIFAFMYPSIIDSCTLFLNNEDNFNKFHDYECFTPDLLNEASRKYENYLDSIVRPVKTLFEFIYFAMIVRLVVVFLISSISEILRRYVRRDNHKHNPEENEPIYNNEGTIGIRKGDIAGDLGEVNNDLNDVL